jgi:hypothetical protein
MSIFAICRRCGLTFESRMINLGPNAFDIRIYDCSESCPRPGCGGIAQLLEGRFDIINDTLHVLEGSRSRESKSRRSIGFASKCVNGQRRTPTKQYRRNSWRP